MHGLGLICSCPRNCDTLESMYVVLSARLRHPQVAVTAKLSRRQENVTLRCVEFVRQAVEPDDGQMKKPAYKWQYEIEKMRQGEGGGSSSSWYLEIYIYKGCISFSKVHRPICLLFHCVLLCSPLLNFLLLPPTLNSLLFIHQPSIYLSAHLFSPYVQTPINLNASQTSYNSAVAATNAAAAAASQQSR